MKGFTIILSTLTDQLKFFISGITVSDFRLCSKALNQTWWLCTFSTHYTQLNHLQITQKHLQTDSVIHQPPTHSLSEKVKKLQYYNATCNIRPSIISVIPTGPFILKESARCLLECWLGLPLFHILNIDTCPHSSRPCFSLCNMELV